MTCPRTPQAVIAELMHVSSAAKPDTVFFAADIGNVGEDANWWKLLKDGKTLKIQLPRSITTFYREPKVCFWLIEMPELENTIIKMSAKRATVAAVKKLPLVSELFATDPRDLPGYKDDDSQPKRTQSRGSSAPASARQSTARHQQSSTEATATGKAQVQVAVNLALKLIEFGMEEESLAMMFLPEGVAKFEDLSEKAAIEVIPGMSELLNNKVKEAKEGKAAAA